MIITNENTAGRQRNYGITYTASFITNWQLVPDSPEILHCSYRHFTLRPRRQRISKPTIESLGPIHVRTWAIVHQFNGSYARSQTAIAQSCKTMKTESLNKWPEWFFFWVYLINRFYLCNASKRRVRCVSLCVRTFGMETSLDSNHIYALNTHYTIAHSMHISTRTHEHMIH